jgi:hypothetical protein
MPRRIVEVEGRRYLFSADDQPPLGDRFWALARLRVLDELTGAPPASPITLESDTPLTAPRIASDGLVGLVGFPRGPFPALATQPYVLQITVRAEGYVSQQVTITVPQEPAFPQVFTPPPLRTLQLHREPVVIMGRTVQTLSSSTTPLAGVTVRVTGIWRTPPPANVVVPAELPNLVSLRPPLYAGRDALVGRLRHRDLPPVLGDDKALLDDTASGATPIRLSNRQNLTPGDSLLIDATSPDLTEFAVIQAIAGASTDAQPAQIALNFPLAYAHRRNAVVQRANPQPFGALARDFTQDGLVGDTCVFLQDLAGLASAREVRITGGPGLPEDHSVRRFSVSSDADGFYRLPPLSRVAQLIMRAERVPFTPVEREFRPDYTRRENRVDFTFR